MLQRVEQAIFWTVRYALRCHHTVLVSLEREHLLKTTPILFEDRRDKVFEEIAFTLGFSLVRSIIGPVKRFFGQVNCWPMIRVSDVCRFIRIVDDKI